MTTDRMDQPDLVSRLAVGRMARELLNEYLKAGKTERATGLVQFCDRLGVEIPSPSFSDRYLLGLVRAGKY